VNQHRDQARKTWKRIKRCVSPTTLAVLNLYSPEILGILAEEFQRYALLYRADGWRAAVTAELHRQGLEPRS
jgi:hypothetical protein